MICVHAFAGRRDDETDEADRALVGAAILAEACADLHAVRAILSEVFKKR